jgi:hypothetical protein
MRSALIALALLATPNLALAQSALDRLEVASERLMTNTLNFYESRVPGLRAVRPDMAWDAQARAAWSCMLNGLQSAKGDAGVATYITEFEAYAARPIVNIRTMSETVPPSMQDATVVQISQSCGTDQVGLAQMQRSGLVAQLSNPAVLAAIMAE